MMTRARVFVDTNILLRATIREMPLHNECKAQVQQLWSGDTELWISRQIIREYLVQVTHPLTLAPPLAIDQVNSQIAKIRSLFRVADDTDSVTTHLMTLLNTHPTNGKQVHDANVVATMLANNIDTLLTLNVDDLKRFADVISLRTVPT
jgi:predicted nucleic acid-binding protein